MKANVVQGAIALMAAYKVEGETILETTCRDYEHFCSLPDVVEYNGTICTKTGWNSDMGTGCYKSDAAFARKVK